MTDPLSPEEIADLTARLTHLEGQQPWTTSKPALRAIMYKAAEIKWRLGLISDDEFAEIEDFHEDFNFEV